MTPSETILQYFGYSHLPNPLKVISGAVAELALEMQEKIPDGPEKTAGLRKLLEAKDCFVRARLEAPEKPWWQTTDLTEMAKEVYIAPVGTEPPTLSRSGNLTDLDLDAIFPPVPVDPPARDWATTTEIIKDNAYVTALEDERAQGEADITDEQLAEAEAVIAAAQPKRPTFEQKSLYTKDGQCFGPTTIIEDEVTQMTHGTCYLGICEWNSKDRPVGGWSMDDLKRDHHSAQEKLR